MSRSIMALFVAALLSGCEDAPPAPPGVSPNTPQAPGAAQPAAAPGQAPKPVSSGASEPADLPPLPVPDIQERDFVESGSSRDPFRSYQELFEVKVASAASARNEKDILVPKYALEELKITGIISGQGGRVLVADPTGLGWVLRVGDFVGRAEFIGGKGTPADQSTPINWRLDRIRENDAVFIRESTDPSLPASTRVLSMRTSEELKQDIRTGIRGTRPDEDPGGGSKESEAAPPKKNRGS